MFAQSLLKVAASLVLCCGLAAGQSPNVSATDAVSLSFTVKDSRGRHIAGLKPDDIRVFEDGIAQTIFTFRQGTGPVIVVDNSGSPPRAENSATKPRFVFKVREQDAEDAYTVTYHSKPGRSNAYRTLRVQILLKVAGNSTVKHTEGYWPDAPER